MLKRFRRSLSEVGDLPFDDQAMEPKRTGESDRSKLSGSEWIFCFIGFKFDKAIGVHLQKWLIRSLPVAVPKGVCSRCA